MKKASLVGHIVESLQLIRSRPRPADTILGEFFRSRHYLGSKDRRFISEAVYGILRNNLLLEAYVTAARQSAGSPIAEEATPLELFVAYARVIAKEGPSEILQDVATLWPEKGAAGTSAQFLEAIDRVALPSGQAGPIQRLSLAHSMPETIVQEWVERFGGEEAARLCAASNLAAPITIRVNTLRCTVEECQSMLEAEGIRTLRTSLSPVGLTLEKRVNVQGLRAFREGAFEMQDEGSQLLSFLLEPAPGSRVVDACAGAGGKTLHLAALMKNAGTILAIDTERRRLDNLRERAERARVSIVEPSLAGGPELGAWTDRADAVLIDAPCTGVGTFRRNPGAKMGFDWKSLAAVTERQSSILEAYAPLLRPGGRLVYATCSLLKEENEDVVERFLRTHPEYHLLSASEVLARQGISVEADSPYLILLPHKTNTDGFFGAVMERARG